MADIEALARALGEIFNPGTVSRDADLRCLMSQDIFYRSAEVAIVARPADAAQVARAVRVAAEHGADVVSRGGGMSYSGGYLARDPANTVLLDMRGMDRIIEINAQDMYVVVEPGCTWAKLHAALDPMGLRTPYWGTLSGQRATVGGGISQNAIFWGSGSAGSAADSVIGMEVVLGSGEIIRTGSLGVPGSNPFNRHFGPDLTGLFTSDAGANGIKTAIALRLVQKPRHVEGMSFVLPDAKALCAFMAEVARQGLAAQQMGLDDGLKTARMAAGGLADDLRTGWQVLRAARHPFVGALQVARMAMAGRGLLDAMPFSAHLFVEAAGMAALAESQRLLRALAFDHGARAVVPSVPQAMIASPFPPLHGMTGPQGERWVPMHCVLPLSRAHLGFEVLSDVFAQHAKIMAQHGITQSWLFTTIGNHAFVIEPMLFWPDALSELHRDALGEKRAARFAPRLAAPVAREAVGQIRKAAVDAVDAIGAVHIQMGAFYPYADRLDEGTAALAGRLGQALAPGQKVNARGLSG